MALFGRYNALYQPPTQAAPNALARVAQPVDPWLAEMQANFARNRAYAKPAQSYQTPLPPQAEAAFRQWVQANRVPFNPNDPVSDYDMRGYWLQLQQGARAGTAINPNDGQLHYPDTYKTPYHKSFSAESKYANKDAPVWVDDHRLVDPKTGRVIFDERAANRR